MKHGDFPMAFEKVKIKEELLSPYCLEKKKNMILK